MIKCICGILAGSSADDESDENSSSSSSRHKKSESIEMLALSPAETAVEHDLDHETEDAMLEFTSGMHTCFNVSILVIYMWF